MKKAILFLFLVAAIGANAQVSKIKSKALGDSIVLRNRGCAEMTPIVVSATGDTARAFDYSVTFMRDTTANVSATVELFDKKGSLLTTVNLSFSATAYRKWALLLTPVDGFVHSTYSRFVKQ